MFRQYIFPLFISSIAFTGTAQAQDEYKWHADIGFQITDIDAEAEILPATYEGALGAINGHVGYNFSPVLGIEGELGVGGKQAKDIAEYDPQINFLVPPPVVDLKQNYLLGMSGRVQFELADDLVLFAKGGVAHSEFKLTQTAESDIVGQGPSITETNFSETGPSFGVGAQYYFSANSGVRFDATRYEFGNYKNTAVSLGYSHRFGLK